LAQASLAQVALWSPFPSVFAVPAAFRTESNMVRYNIFAAACGAILSAACPFGGTGPLPDGHPAVDGRKLESVYPGWIVDERADDAGSLSDAWPGSGPSTWNPFLDTLVQFSADAGDAELCYWSFQTLPGPQMKQEVPSVTLEDVNLWFENTNNEANNFADMAVKRMQSLVATDGPVMWTGCAVGATLRQAMCDNNMALSNVSGGTMADCSLDAVYNQTLMTPTAIVLFKFRNSTVQAFKDVLHSWRTESGGHVPQMTSDLIQGGWGPGGQIISKTVPCGQIPEKYRYQNLGDCDEMGDSGITIADEAFQVWSSLCSITKDGCESSGSTPSPSPSEDPSSAPSPPPSEDPSSDSAPSATRAYIVAACCLSIVVFLRC